MLWQHFTVFSYKLIDYQHILSYIAQIFGQAQKSINYTQNTPKVYNTLISKIVSH